MPAASLLTTLLVILTASQAATRTYPPPPTKTTTTSLERRTSVWVLPPILIGTQPPNPPRIVPSGGRCGRENAGNVCGGGSCCSSKGWCGKDVRFCGAGCRVGFGYCWTSTKTTTTRTTTTAVPNPPPPAPSTTTTRTTTTRTPWATPSLRPEPFQSSSQRSDCLLAHNEVRRDLPNNVQIPALAYNTTLERLACYWSRYLADQNAFAHSSGQVGNSGENLYRVSHSPALAPNLTGADIGSCRPAVKSWASEKQFYEPGWRIGVDGNFGKYGHYTQIVWGRTKEVGCCAAQSPSGKDIVWTCHYSPRGNYKNQTPY